MCCGCIVELLQFIDSGMVLVIHAAIGSCAATGICKQRKCLPSLTPFMPHSALTVLTHGYGLGPSKAVAGSFVTFFVCGIL
jgi:hypothetical protein